MNIKEKELIKQLKYSSGILRKKLYQEYLKTDYWKMKRYRALKRADFICEICKLNKAVQVHHLSYKHLGCERRHELVAICKHCHYSEHFKETTLFTEDNKEIHHRKKIERRRKAIEKAIRTGFAIMLK